ncbi:MAG: C45 family autoproteolytic acyltransferase/hydrolase [Verrucomicrobiota bacterium]
MKWLRRIFFSVAITVIAMAVGCSAMLRHWQASPPPLPPEATAVLAQRIVEHDGKRWVGRCWAGQHEGLPVLYLTGTPFEMGYASGLLNRDRLYALEDAALAMVHRYVPHEWTITLLKNYIIYRNRHLMEFVPPRFQMELFGMTRGCPDIHPKLGSYYNRVLNYHAAQDISYMLIDNPLVMGNGCTSFGAWGTATANGHLLAGRNFDWEADPIFDRDRLVTLCEPADGIPFVSLAWAGMAGVVSGLNRAGVSVALNGAPSELPHEIGTPAAIVAREILERAHNLAEATAILEDAHVFVSTLWLIGSRADGRFIVVEKTPQATQVREPTGDQIICANHFMTDGLKDLARNVTFRSDSTSVARYARVGELMNAPLTIPRVVEILRDRNLAGDQFAGNGHRSSLNADIATHSTATDLTAGIFWAATTPHLLGKFVAFDVNDFARKLPAETVPADPALKTFAQYQQAQKCLTDGHLALKNDKPHLALKMAEQAQALNPGFYENATLQGRALLALGRTNEATQAFTAALAGKPAFAKERKELEALIHAAR